MGDEKDGLIYFRDGELIAESGVDTKSAAARVYSMVIDGTKELFLELGQGHTLWAHSMEWEDYVYQLSGRPRGECLEIGLGLGVASKYILSCPKVERLTTVELNNNVIDVHKQTNPIDDKWGLISFNDRHTILNSEGLSFMWGIHAKKKYDFIFIDCYDRIDEETMPLIADMAFAAKRLLKEDGEVVGWFDNGTPEEFIAPFFGVFKDNFVV